MVARTSWQERPEGGGQTAIRFVSWCALNLGRPFCRLAMYFIALYFFIKRGPERRASRAFHSRVAGRPVSRLRAYRHMHRYANVLLDRNYLLTDPGPDIRLEVHGLNLIHTGLQQGRGAILLNAHFGSFEAVRVLSSYRPDLPLKILLAPDQNKHITQTLAALNPELSSNIVDPGDGGPELVLNVARALQQGAMVGIMADRYLHRQRRHRVQFLGDGAEFPLGPFELAIATRAPVFMIYGIYDGKHRYQVHFDPMTVPVVQNRSDRQAAARELTESFAAKLEQLAREHPYNWFNFYDFWS